MPDFDPELLVNSWLAYTTSQDQLLGIDISDRPLDQYLEFRGRVVRLVTDPDFLGGLRACQKDLVTGPSPYGLTDPVAYQKLIETLRGEVEASARASEVALALHKADHERSWIKRMLGRGSTTTKSVSEIFAAVVHKYPLLSGGLTLFAELQDIFKE